MVTTKLFDTVLVANRGEIAVRVIRSLKALGIRSVAVYSDADAGALHVAEADVAVRIGPGAAIESYLSIPAILAACRRSGAQAVHPGYGFLAENLDFARALEDAGITFIGPDVISINLMGDKIRSKNHVMSHGVPVVPGIAKPGLTNEELIAAADSVGYPLLIKPSAGGGGKGMFVVESAAELSGALASARRTAASAFGDDTLFLERLVRNPRHIEVQVLADRHGNTVHLGERECSLQRRHQKVIEEAPSPLLENHAEGERIRAEIGAAAVAAARSVDYVGAGTVEFLVSDENPGEFFFMEMNTRLQVEHPVTEEVVRIKNSRIDLVEWQVRIAAGQALDFTQDQVQLHGHATEARVYAEDPAHDFMPSIGTILSVTEAAGEHIRVDSSLREGLEISSFYDPMVAKVIAWGTDRAQSLARLDRALASTVVLGVLTNIEYLRLLITDEDVAAGRLDTNLIGRKMPTMDFRAPTDAELALAAHLSRAARGRTESPWQRGDGWRLGAHVGTALQVEVDRQTRALTFRSTGSGSAVTIDETDFLVETAGPGRFSINGMAHGVATAASADGTIWLSHDGWTAGVRPLDRAEVLARELAAMDRGSGALSPLVRSPMPGTVIAVQVSDGEQVAAGQVLATIEAMKMEHRMLSPTDGIVDMGHLKAGDLVKANQIIATVTLVETDASDTDITLTDLEHSA
ncbi:acetyl/propionyl-CoA carboxylase subunit alpha [Arthrobacter sp. AQ5-05]|uniref:acetyl/propionyl/methylcrotonyl-CoA carboxylase subunit alpha n=1 Tax=Arthrobacter sp. AQ5-05 TaxID=2184581 RepID=UPI000DCE88FD|nr:biotin carboxylase N-terminal domain-containing protein [Arthrobacter sp. AQ5-05]RAX48299.1 acetyl/propionyl-CoA carboxylase subunit alpha [Arthrobacter sp. AQ5-05]